MDPVRNPYLPGAGQIPPVLAGRDAELSAWDIALARIEAGRPAQPLVLYGLRGVGKTVLLTKFAQAARDRDWIVARVEAKTGQSLRAQLGESLHDSLVDLARPSAGTRILKALKTALSFKASYDPTGSWTFGVDLRDDGGGADTGSIEVDLRKLLLDLAAGAAESGHGVAVLVDEAQDLPLRDREALIAAAHVAGQESEALTLAMAGLPSLPRELAEAKSYAERLFAYHPVGALDPVAAAAALAQPAAQEGVAWEEAGLDHAARAARGYPYFLQQFGQGAWDTAEGPTITLADARLGVERGKSALDNGFFRIRWERATPAERRYLKAMANDAGQPSDTASVAARLGRTASGVSSVRGRLIEKGLIYSPATGRVAFTVPLMADFIDRQIEFD
ncbi:MAG: ATP-binding protein [Bifidobacteriaceae bacterium]|jgi:hypothetical protein|nr:ATP-binding protein [Bifidobacteriaceae bacterium]